MKSGYILILIILLFTACGSSDDCIEVNYDNPFIIEINQDYCLPDGTVLQAEAFVNNYCPCLAECIWEGELVIEMLIGGSPYSFHSTDMINMEEAPFDLVIELVNLPIEICGEITGANIIISKK